MPHPLKKEVLKMQKKNFFKKNRINLVSCFRTNKKAICVRSSEVESIKRMEKSAVIQQSNSENID